MAISIYLHVAFDEIERGDGHVSEAAARDPADSEGGVLHMREYISIFLLSFGTQANIANPPSVVDGGGEKLGFRLKMLSTAARFGE